MSERNTRRIRFISTFELILLIAALFYLGFTYLNEDEPKMADSGQNVMDGGSNPVIPQQNNNVPSPNNQVSEPLAQPTVELSLTMPEPGYDICCGRIPTKIKVWGNPAIQNTGAMTAHNVRVTFGLQTPGGETIKLSGGGQIERYLGDLKSGQSTTERVEFTLSLVDGYKIQDSGAVAIFNILSDEKDFRILEEFAVDVGG